MQLLLFLILSAATQLLVAKHHRNNHDKRHQHHDYQEFEESEDSKKHHGHHLHSRQSHLEVEDHRKVFGITQGKHQDEFSEHSSSSRNVRHTHRVVADWEKYKLLYNKTYEDYQSERYHRRIYMTRVDEINEFNGRTNETYTIGIDFMSDWSESDFQSFFGGFNIEESEADEYEYTTHPDNLPTSKDWTDRHFTVVTKPKDQEGCGGCWAFALTGAIESMANIPTRAGKNLAFAQLVDCANPEHGCDGLDPMTACKKYLNKSSTYVAQLEDYKEFDQTGLSHCRWDRKTMMSRAEKVQDCVLLTGEQQMKEIIATHGPITAYIDPKGLFGYTGGIISKKGCLKSAKKLDHVVLVVGYGEEGGIPFWKCKNSWGPSWGGRMKGFFKIIRNQNMCGIGSRPMKVIVRN